MYRLNPLKRKVLITTDEVVFHAAFEHTIDPRQIQQAIIIAEERIIRNSLGFEFYEFLRGQKNVLVTSANKTALEVQINGSMEPGTELVTLAVGDLVNSCEFLSNENKLLWDEYLWKLTAEAVRFAAIPQNYAAFTSQGIVHNAPGIMGAGLNGNSTATPDLKTAKWLVDRSLSDAIDPLAEAMHVWLCKMKGAGMFAHYAKPCDCNSNGVSYQRKTDILLGIYDDDEEKFCCS